MQAIKMVKVDKPYFTIISNILKTVSKFSNLSKKAYFDVDNKYLVATDGKRIIRIETKMLKSDFSQVLQNSYVEIKGDMLLVTPSDLPYVNYMRLYEDVFDGENKGEYDFESGEYSDVNISKVICDLQFYCNVKFLQDIKGFIYTILFRHRNAGILFTTIGIDIIIMPFRKED